jgi:hypothetical protein
MITLSCELAKKEMAEKEKEAIPEGKRGYHKLDSSN